MTVDAWRRFVPGLWAGWLLCVALLATPAPFALLAPAEAGRIVGRMLAQEAYTSLALGLVLLVLERVHTRRRGGPQFGAQLALVLGALFCTVAGYFAVQPMMAGARAGAGPLTFGQLHAVSATFYGVKALLVLALAWRAAAR
jgi:Domain of unknown function (DUF4149)